MQSKTVRRVRASSFLFRFCLSVCGGLLPGPAWADAPALPVQNTGGHTDGIAAQHPGDVGIERAPRVLFAENFETGTVEAVGQRWGEVSNKEGKVMAFSSDVSPASP